MDFEVPLEYENKNWYNILKSPNDIYEQDFGFEIKPGMETKTGYSIVRNGETTFEIKLSLGHFEKKNVRVYKSRNHVIISLEHEEKSEDGGIISRKTERIYPLPDECEAEYIKAFVSLDKVVMVECGKQSVQKDGGIVKMHHA